jgi:hypothetical protein
MEPTVVPQSHMNYGSSPTEMESGRPPALLLPGARTLVPLPSVGSLYRAVVDIRPMLSAVRRRYLKFSGFWPDDTNRPGSQDRG